LPGISTKDSTCMDLSVCFFTSPKRLMDLSVTYSHVYNLKFRKTWLDNTVEGNDKWLSNRLPPNIFPAKVPLRNLVMDPLASTRLVASTHHNVSLVVSQLIYTKTTLILKYMFMKLDVRNKGTHICKVLT
jgi:hypothetical protein